MPWYRFGAPGQDSVAHMLICRRGGSPALCGAARFPLDNPALGEKCGRVSEALCDGPAGETLGGKSLTCDMPLCKEHRTNVGPNRDLCPRCAEKARADGRLVDGVTLPKP